MTPSIVRPVGDLEKYSTSRHSLGLYRSVTVSGRYFHRIPIERDYFQATLNKALSQVILHNPALCCGIIGEDSSKPSVIHLEKIDFRRAIEVSDYYSSISSADEILCKVLEENHDKLWPNLHQEPGWKLVVCPHTSSGSESERISVVDLIFIFHHALCDGLSGVGFHHSLLAELRVASNLNSNEPDWTVETSPSVRFNLIKPVEKLIEFPVSWLFTITQVIRAFAPSWISLRTSEHWSGPDCQLVDVESYKSRVRLITLESDKVNNLLVTTRRHGSTLTCLLTGLIVFSLAQALPQAKSFIGVTPYTLRRFTKTSVAEIVNQSSGFETNYSNSLIESIRAHPFKSDDAIQTIWKVASLFQKEMNLELDKAPRDNPIGLLPLVSNFHDLFSKKLGRKRETTFEVSNVGVFQDDDTHLSGSDNNSSGRDWNIQSMTFSQGAQVVGSALALSCISVKNGPLRLTLTWQDGLLDDSLIDTIQKNFETSLMHILEHETNLH